MQAPPRPAKSPAPALTALKPEDGPPKLALVLSRQVCRRQAHAQPARALRPPHRQRVGGGVALRRLHVAHSVPAGGAGGCLFYTLLWIDTHARPHVEVHLVLRQLPKQACQPSARPAGGRGGAPIAAAQGTQSARGSSPPARDRCRLDRPHQRRHPRPPLEVVREIGVCYGWLGGRRRAAQALHHRQVVAIAAAAAAAAAGRARRLHRRGAVAAVGASRAAGAAWLPTPPHCRQSCSSSSSSAAVPRARRNL